MGEPDYKEMYLTMIRESEKAMNGLIAAQQKCEEIYVSAFPEGKPEHEKDGH